MRFFRLQNLALGLSLLAFSGIFAALTAPVAHAQADLGSISGTVTDTTGAFVPKAQVTVTNIANGAVRVSVTGSRGEFTVSQLNPAQYTVSITAPGFATATEHVSVTVGSDNNFSAKLAVAGGKTEVVVEADDFAGVQLERPEVSAVIETQQILSLPTLDRNPYSLVAFSGNLSSDPTAAARGVGFNISGSRSSSVDILLDGVENTDLYAVGVGQSVPLDATQEIRIVTSNGGAEYGRGSGAVNVSTKSGTNGFHGSAYEFNRVSTLASAGYNNNYIHAVNPSVPDKPRYTHNQPGYSIGGPIKKDKLFFFSSTEWTRIRSAQNIIAAVPTSDLIGMSAANMQDFFNTYGTLEHPINGTQLTGATIQGNDSGLTPLTPLIFTTRMTPTIPTSPTSPSRKTAYWTRTPPTPHPQSSPTAAPIPASRTPQFAQAISSASPSTRFRPTRAAALRSTSGFPSTASITPSTRPPRCSFATSRRAWSILRDR